MTSIYTLIGTKTILGKKKSIYKKKGTTKKYCKCKGRMMNIVKYKKSKTKSTIKKKKGGNAEYASVDAAFHLDGGAKKKTKKTKKSKK